MIVRSAGPKVALVTTQMPVQAPSSELERVAACRLDVLRCDAERRELAQVCGVELHRPDVERPIGVADPLSGAAALLLCDCQHHVGRNLESDRSLYTAGNPFVQSGRQLVAPTRVGRRARREADGYSEPDAGF